jgi:hypothetical protein
MTDTGQLPPIEEPEHGQSCVPPDGQRSRRRAIAAVLALFTGVPPRMSFATTFFPAVAWAVVTSKRLRDDAPGATSGERRLEMVAFDGVGLRLSVRHRKCLVIEFHVAPQPTQALYQDSEAFDSLSRRLFGRISGQFCSM